MTTTEKAADSFFTFITAHPKVVLAGFLASTVFFGVHARDFKIDASADTLLTKGDRNYIQSRVINRRFSPREFMLIAYEPVGHPLFSEKTFADLRSLSEKLLRLDRVESVRSMLNVPVFSKADADLDAGMDVSKMTLEHRKLSVDEIRKAFHAHPLYEDLIINKDQTAAALQVVFKRDKTLDDLNSRITDLEQKSIGETLTSDETRELARLKERVDPMERHSNRVRSEEITAVRRIVSEYEKDARIYIGGLHVLAHQLIRIIENDLVVFGGAIAAMICLMLYLLFGGLRWVLIPVICCTCSLISTMGLFGWLGFKTTVISSNFVALQLILTLAVVVHLIVQYREYGLAHPEWGQRQLVRQTMIRKVSPCFYAGLTTAVGFASLVFSNLQPVISFGWMMIVAMGVALGASLVLFPVVMVLFLREQPHPRPAFSRAFLDWCTRLTLKRGTLVVWSSLCLVAVSALGLTQLIVENSFINYFRARTQVYKELSFIDRHFGGTTPLDIVYTLPDKGPEDDLVVKADDVQVLQKIQQALRKHKAMGTLVSIVNFTELARQINRGKPLTEYELTAIYWTLEEDARENLVGSLFSPETREARINARIIDTTENLSRSELMGKIRKDFEKLGIPKHRYVLSNAFVLYLDILLRLFRSQILTLGLVYAVLSLTFLMIFRSIKIALIGIVPNIFPVIMLLGLMGWMSIPLDLMTITIAAIAMGIAVDDAIHYIHRYLEELETGSARSAVGRSLSTVGDAMIYTSLIIVLGFSMLAFSDFVPSVLFGLLTGLALTLSLVFNITLLPVLLHKFIRFRKIS